MQIRIVHIQLLGRWIAMATGRCYWYQPQNIGGMFCPGKLLGYFNDLRSKAAWPGQTDQAGLPLDTVQGRAVYWPNTIFQKGLAHWDLQLEQGPDCEEHRRAFEVVARWAVESQDQHGGWPYPIPLHPRALSSYSCISQGQGISVLVRAYSQTGDMRFLWSAKAAIDAMLMPTAQGGCAVYDRDHILLEEYPSAAESAVLNGWIFAIYGLYDFGLVTQDAEAAEALQATLRGLDAGIDCFDCGYWSLYDRSGALASPFYHRLHIAQLQALAKTFPQHHDRFVSVATRFERYSASPINFVRAVTQKISQKLRNPPNAFLQSSCWVSSDRTS